MALTHIRVPCLSDNYCWLLRDASTGAVAIVDPGEAAPVQAALTEQGWTLTHILLTHHHADHVGGVAELKARHGAEVIGAEADAHRLPALDRALRTGESVALGDSTGVVLDTPGHTRGHIAFHFPADGLLLCGDSLFVLGCGRLLEGTAEELFDTLRQFALMPPETLVLCGHEYTEGNAKFARHVDPGNERLREIAAEVKKKRAKGLPTVPSTLGDEFAANPFMRAPDAVTFARLRAAKDDFR